MMTRDHGNIIIVCDRCDLELNTGTDRFWIATRLWERQGWRSSQRAKEEEATHFCGACVKRGEDVDAAVS